MEILIQKSKLKANKIKTDEYHGKKYLQIMEMWKEKEEDDWRFSKKNVTFNASSIKEFISFIQTNSEDILKELGAEDAESS